MKAGAVLQEDQRPWEDLDDEEKESLWPAMVFFGEAMQQNLGNQLGWLKQSRYSNSFIFHFDHRLIRISRILSFVFAVMDKRGLLCSSSGVAPRKMILSADLYLARIVAVLAGETCLGDTIIYDISYIIIHIHM